MEKNINLYSYSSSRNNRYDNRRVFNDKGLVGYVMKLKKKQKKPKRKKPMKQKSNLQKAESKKKITIMLDRRKCSQADRKKHIVNELQMVNTALQLVMADIHHYFEDEEALKNGGVEK